MDIVKFSYILIWIGHTVLLIHCFFNTPQT